MASLKFKHPAGVTYALFDEIDMEGRGREDYGDVEALRDHILEFGLIHPPTCLLLDPPVNGKKYRLLAGGRRTHAINLIGGSHIPIMVRKDDIAKDNFYLLELGENQMRKEMTWQESAILIHKAHLHFCAQGRKADNSWGHKETGRLFGISSSHASHAVTVAGYLLQGDAEIRAATSISAAFDILLRRREQELDADLSRKYQQPQGAKPTIVSSNGTASITVISNDIELDPVERLLGNGTPTLPNLLTTNESTATEYPISQWCVMGDAFCGPEPILQTWLPESVHHIITDPPYGIDVDDETLVNAVEISATHDREENLAMFPHMMAQCYRVLRDRGYAIFWMDIEHKDMLSDLARQVGFSVQKTPFHWIKTHRCKNLAAATNFTNSTEHALICRKGTATLEVKGALNYVIADGSIERKMYSNPFAKPYAVWAPLIQAVSRPGDIIVDPCAGEGSCPRAVLNLGRSPRAIEIDQARYNKLLLNMEKTVKEIAGSNAIIT